MRYLQLQRIPWRISFALAIDIVCGCVIFYEAWQSLVYQNYVLALCIMWLGVCWAGIFLATLYFLVFHYKVKRLEFFYGGAFLEITLLSFMYYNGKLAQYFHWDLLWHPVDFFLIFFAVFSVLILRIWLSGNITLSLKWWFRYGILAIATIVPYFLKTFQMIQIYLLGFLFLLLSIYSLDLVMKKAKSDAKPQGIK